MEIRLKIKFLLLRSLLAFAIWICISKSHGQTIPAGNKLFEDNLRREQLVEGFDSHNNSFALRPLINKFNNNQF